jgi:hypothetical protein
MKRLRNVPIAPSGMRAGGFDQIAVIPNNTLVTRTNRFIDSI